MKSKFSLMVLAIIIMFLLGACGKEDEAQVDEVSEESPEASSDTEENDSEMETETEVPFTLGGMEVTPFDKVEGKTAIRLSPADWNQPYEVDDLRWKMYYGDHEFVTLAVGEGIFRYDLKSNQVKWNTAASVTETKIHNGVLYSSQLEESNSYANIGTIDLVSGEIINYFEEEDHRMAANLQFVGDNIMLFTSSPIDAEDYKERDLFAYDLQSGSRLWTTAAAANQDQQAIDIGDGILLVSDLTHDGFEDHIASVFDKETGEEKFQIVANAINKSPVMNEEGIYFANYQESSIQLYDVDGSLKEEIYSDIGFGLYQLTTPIATDEAFILADNEGIVWYSPDLSSIQHRVELGESTLRYMRATDDRVYVIASDEETGEFFTVSLDISTGEAYEKISLDITENTVIHLNVYNNKFSFAVINDEGDIIHHVFSGEDVNKPMTE